MKPYTVTIRCGSQKSVCRKHNERDEKTVLTEMEKEKRELGREKSHIDLDKSKNNIMVQRDVEEVYNTLFGEALEEWNNRQTMKDRKIDNYLKHCIESKQLNSEYEVIIQIGNQDHKPTEEEAIEILSRYVDSFEDNNPNFKITGAYIHLDEATPHLHLDYVCYAHCNRGMRVQNSQNGAFKEMGYISSDKKHTPQMMWQQKQEEVLIGLCNELGFEIKQPRTHREHQKQELYQLKQEIEQSKIQSDNLQQNIAFSKQVLKSYKEKEEQSKEELQELKENLEEQKYWIGKLNGLTNQEVSGFVDVFKDYALTKQQQNQQEIEL